jgi:hypothetical protein
MSVEPWIVAWPLRAMMPAAGAPYVPEEELQDGCGADDLDALGVLGPADRVAQRRRPLARRVLADGLGDRQERLLGVPQTFSTISGVYLAK